MTSHVLWRTGMGRCWIAKSWEKRGMIFEEVVRRTESLIEAVDVGVVAIPRGRRNPIQIGSRTRLCLLGDCSIDLGRLAALSQNMILCSYSVPMRQVEKTGAFPFWAVLSHSRCWCLLGH